MGQPVQTLANGLKPYGLVYDLIMNHKIPVKWVIDPAKPNGGVDFTYAAKDYRGGPFVIPAEFAGEAAPVIALWQGKGVVVDGPTVSSITVDVYDTLTSFPRTVLDLQNGDIAADYLVNAEIPGSSYREDLPANLNTCDDLYAMPHADPTWSTHQNLKPFNDQGGFIWAACHAVSVLENVSNPVNPGDTLQFLSADGLVDFGDHDDGTLPYDHFNATDSIMQFLGTIDAATTGGSEQIYVPQAAGWRGTTTLSVVDPDQPDALALGVQAAALAYGRGYGRSSNGLVMYEAGHSHAKSTAPANVAAQRAFLNLLLQAGIERRPQVISTVPSGVDSLETVAVSASVVGGGGGFSYQWISSCGGSFADPTAPTTTFTAPASDVNLDCILRVVVIDTCSRLGFEAEPVLVIGKPNLNLTKTDSQDPAPTNGSFSYTLTVQNPGGDADDVTLIDPLPAEVSFVSVSPGAPTCSYDGGAHEVTCDLGTLVTGSPAQNVTITVMAPATPVDISNTASVSSPDGDLDPSDNVASETTAVRPATDLQLVSKTVSPTTTGIGGSASYTIQLRNDGPLDATNVVMSDPLPAGLSFVAASGSGWSCSFVVAGSEVRCVRATLAAATAAPDITVQVVATVSGMLANTATVSSADVADTNPANDSQTAILDVQAAADLSIFKTTDKSDAADGNTLHFTLNIRNDGPDTANNVVVTDTLPFSRDKNIAIGFRDFYDIRKYDFTGPLGTTVSGNGASRSVTVDGLTITVDYSPATSGPPSDMNPTPEPAYGTPVDVIWTVSPGLAAGETLELVFEAKKEGDGLAINSATVTADEPDPDPSDDSDSIPIQKNVKEADLQVRKTAPASVSGGDPYSYTLSVKNNGPEKIDSGSSPFNFFSVVDTLPEGVSYVGFAQLASATPIPPDTGVSIKKGTWACSFDAPSREVTCSYTLDQGDNFDAGRYAWDLRLDVTAPAAPGTITNTAEVSYAIAGLVDNTHGNDNSSADTDVLPGSTDLRVEKSVDDPAPLYGANATFTVTVTNDGPDDATSVQLSDPLPPGLSHQSHVASTGVYDPGAGSWLVGDLATGASASLDITVQVDAVGSLSNTATLVSLDQTDTNAANDAASAALSVAGADVGLTKVVDDGTPDLGSNVVFTVTLSNAGPDDTTPLVEVTDQLPAGFAYVSHVASQGSYTPGTGVWDVGLVTNGGSATLDVTAEVQTTDPLVNEARITSTDPADPNSANDVASVNVDGVAADLRLEKTVDIATPLPPYPTPVVFTLTLTNDGPDPATGVEVTDLLPAGLAYVSHVLGDPTDAYDPVTGVWLLGDVAVGDLNAQTLEITANVTQSGTIDNTANVTASAPADPEATNNEATRSLSAGGEADLFIVKSVDDASPDAGDPITFSIALDNYGPDDATNVEVTDLLPAGTSYQTHTAPAGTSYDAGTGTWTIPSLAADTQIVLEIDALAASVGVHVNTATITASDQGDPDPIPTESSAIVDVRGLADLSLTKTVDDPSPGVGDTVVFTLTVSNAGPDPSTSAEVTDLLPAGLGYVSHLASTGSYSPVTGLWDIPGIPVGGSVTLDLTASVDQPGEITNTAEVTDSEEKDPDSFPGNAVPAEDDQDSRTLNGGVAVSGFVYADANHNATRDGGEAGSGETLYAKLVDAGSPGGPAEQVVAVDPVTGAYALVNVAAGTWQIVLDTSSDPSDVSVTLPTGWLGSEEPDGLRELTLGTNPVANQDFGLFHGSRLAGVVFADDGAGGGTAGNGLQDGSEGGLAGVALEAQAPGCGGACDATTTQGDGAYVLWIPSAADGETASVVESNPAGMASTGGSAGTTGGSYVLATDTTSFLNAAGSSYTGVDFADAGGSGFSPDHERTALPGTAVFFPHVFRAGAGGTVTFSTSHVAAPALPGWASSVYRDLDCSGVLDAGEPLLPAGAPQPVLAGANVCVVVRESVPPGAPIGAQDVVTLTADFTPSGGGASTSLAVTDLTRVGAGGGAGLALRKDVDKTTALPGELLVYTLTYRNDGTEPITDLVVHDATPPFTTYVGGSVQCGAPLPAALASCTPAAPAGGASGRLDWTFTGSLDPGQSGTLSYTIRIE
jgi:uncharacterized repeat protein (TIGR01451 family)